MSYAVLLYLYTVLTAVSSLAFFISLFLIISFFIFIMSFVGTIGYKDDNLIVRETFNKFLKKPLKWVLPICIAIILIVPSKEDMYFILGGSALIAVGKTEEAKKLPDNVLKAANTFLEKLQENKK